MIHGLVAKLMLVPVAMILLSFALPKDDEKIGERKPASAADVIVSDLLNGDAKR